MVYCSKCGRENPSESKYCNACGATLYDGSQSVQEMTQPTTYTAPATSKPKSYWTRSWSEYSAQAKAALVVACILSFTFGATFVYSMEAGAGWYGSDATVHITVQSTHIRNTVDVKVVVEGRVIESRSLGPLDSFTVDYKPLMWFHDSETVQIWATAEGGGLGQMQDIETVTINKGDVLNVHLMI